MKRKPAPSPFFVHHFFQPRFLLLLILLFTITLLGFRFFHLSIFRDSQGELQVAQPVEMSGIVHFTALQPDPSDKGTLEILVRAKNQNQWVNTGLSLPLQQDVSWQWPAARPGVTYDVQARLKIDGRVTKQSMTEVVTAPAMQLMIPLEINWTDLPKEVIKGSKTVLGGQVVVNGYLPAQSTLEIYMLPFDNQKNTFEEITPELIQTAQRVIRVSPVQAANTWQWNAAIPLEDYQVMAVLRDRNHKVIGLSNQLIIADASENSLHHVLNSTAQPPAVQGVQTSSVTPAQQVLGTTTATVSMSGTAYLQGPIANNSSLLLLWRKPGDTTYNVINRYINPDGGGVSWQWPDAQVGQTYEISAALQVNNNNTSVLPNPITVTAPATQVNFTLNTYYLIPTTPGIPVLETCLNEQNNNWTAVIRLPAVAGAGNYWVQVGNSPIELGNVFNQKISANGGTQDMKVNVTVLNAEQHYVEYAYSNCTNCQNNQNFAPFSQVVAFTCE